MLKKLRARFICITMSILVVMLCIIFGLVLSSTARALEQESIRMMQTVGSGPVKPPRPGELQAAVNLPYFILHTGLRGEVFATGGAQFDLSDTEYLMELSEMVYADPHQIGVLKAYQLRFYKITGPGPQGIVFADMSNEIATLKNLVAICLTIGGVSLLLFFAVSTFLARWAVRPVENAWQQQKQFVADASHELKTPLTVILTNAELLQEPQSTEMQRSLCVDSILTMSRQMRGLVESLLELARVDNGTVQTVQESVNLSQLVSDGVLPFEPLFFEKDLQLHCSIAEGLFLRGSGSHLRQVADILLDNAMKYTPAGGQVWVQLRRQGNHCLLTVANTGPAIPEEEWKNLFKRFYRVEKARSMNGSYGLGLSIAQRIVEEHRGRIWVESRDGVNRFFVQLPAQSGRKENER